MQLYYNFFLNIQAFPSYSQTTTIFDIHPTKKGGPRLNSFCIEVANALKYSFGQKQNLFLNCHKLTSMLTLIVLNINPLIFNYFYRHKVPYFC